MIRALFYLLLLAALALGLFYLYEGGELPCIGGTIGDAGTTASVKAALALHRDLSQRSISVRTRDAVVLLTGEVASEEEKREAEMLARSVDRVRDVDNLIAVTPGLQSEDPSPERSIGQRLDDTALAAKVRGAFALHRELKDLDISFDVRGATVYLEGRVATREQADLAQEWASSIEGVRSVENLLQLTGDQETMEQVATRVEATLNKNDNLRSYNLRAVVDDDVIVLKGRVRTGAERELAELLAERVTGRRELQNAIRVGAR
jgi:osmotically-inducible protein OsmY